MVSLSGIYAFLKERDGMTCPSSLLPSLRETILLFWSWSRVGSTCTRSPTCGCDFPSNPQSCVSKSPNVSCCWNLAVSFRKFACNTPALRRIFHGVRPLLPLQLRVSLRFPRPHHPVPSFQIAVLPSSFLHISFWSCGLVLPSSSIFALQESRRPSTSSSAPPSQLYLSHQDFLLRQSCAAILPPSSQPESLHLSSRFFLLAAPTCSEPR